MGKDVKVDEKTENPAAGIIGGDNISSISATTRADAILMGLQYSRSF